MLKGINKLEDYSVIWVYCHAVTTQSIIELIEATLWYCNKIKSSVVQVIGSRRPGMPTVEGHDFPGHKGLFSFT